MGCDRFIVEVEGEGMVISLGHDLFADGPGGHGIGV